MSAPACTTPNHVRSRTFEPDNWAAILAAAFRRVLARADGPPSEATVAEGVAFPAALTEELHVLPYFHGNRSPRADPSLRGMISGLKLSASVDALAILYLSTVQAIAHGTRHIVDAMNAAGYRIDTLIACGGAPKKNKKKKHGWD